MEPALETIREALELAQKQRRALRHMMSRGAHCPGDEVELGVWKGCDQKLDGDTTCEMHGEDGDAVLDDAMRMLHLVDEQLNGLTREVGRLAEAQEVRH